MKVSLVKSNIGLTVGWKRSDIEKWCHFIEGFESKVIGNICLYFVTEEEILLTNRTFLTHNYITDVITFAEVHKGIFSADIYICLEEVFRNATLLSVDRRSELGRVIIHGILHALGWEDGTIEERQKMREREDYYLHTLGLD